MHDHILKLRRPLPGLPGSAALRERLTAWLLEHPKSCLAVITPLALTGYLLLLLFPASGVILLGQFIGDWSLQNSLQLPPERLLQLLAGLAALLFSLPLWRLQLPRPGGQALAREEMPELDKTLSALCQHYHTAPVDSVIIDERMDMRLLNQSKLAWPFAGPRTLVIGLPLLLCCSPGQFHALLARCIGRYSKRESFLLLWIACLEQTWRDYARALSRSGVLGLPLAGLFRLYNRLLRPFTGLARHWHELAADRSALELVNDQDMAELFSWDVVLPHFLQTKYWPKVRQLARRETAGRYPPWASMRKVVRNGLQQEHVRHAIQNAFRQAAPGLRQPSLQARLHNIGHENPRPPRRPQEDAGRHYLSASALENIIAARDQAWQQGQDAYLQRSLAV